MLCTSQIISLLSGGVNELLLSFIHHMYSTVLTFGSSVTGTLIKLSYAFTLNIQYCKRLRSLYLAGNTLMYLCFVVILHYALCAVWLSSLPTALFLLWPLGLGGMIPKVPIPFGLVVVCFAGGHGLGVWVGVLCHPCLPQFFFFSFLAVGPLAVPPGHVVCSVDGALFVRSAH